MTDNSSHDDTAELGDISSNYSSAANFSVKADEEKKETIKGGDMEINQELIEATVKAVIDSLQQGDVEVKAIVEAPIEEVEESLRMAPGVPTDAELAKIVELTGCKSEAGDWLVVPFMASNCFINSSLRRWSTSTPYQMGSTAVGRPLIKDHNLRDSDEALGFICSANVVIDREVSDKILNGDGYGEYNKEILDREGFVWLHLVAAIPTNSEGAEAVRSRKFSDCSTGTKLEMPDMTCPDCEKVHGRQVSFFETQRDSKGRESLTCPHLIPDPWMQSLMHMHNIPEDEYNFASYAILGGMKHELMEHSVCNKGALSAARILRGE